MLRTWLVKISPETGSPIGSTTLVPKGRMREVIGQTIANSVTRQKSAGETTSAGRLPLCSRPTRGSKSAQIRSPASGTYGIALFDDLATFIRSPIERFSHCLRGHPLQQIGEDIAWASRRNDDTVALCLYVDPGSLAQTRSKRNVFGNAQAKAVAPACDLHLHRPLRSASGIYIGYPILAVKPAVDAAFLHAAEGAISPAGFRRDDALVDADDAVFQRLGDAPDAPPPKPSPASARLSGENSRSTFPKVCQRNFP